MEVGLEVEEACAVADEVTELVLFCAVQLKKRLDPNVAIIRCFSSIILKF